MTIKNRGLGRGLEALLVNVPTLKDAQEQILVNDRDVEHNELAINNSDSATIQETTQMGVQVNSKHVSNLLQEAESLRALLIEFEEILLNR